MEYEYSFKGCKIERCNNCPCVFVGIDAEYHCGLTGQVVYSDCQPPVDCPLVERKCDDCV